MPRPMDLEADELVDDVMRAVEPTLAAQNIWRVKARYIVDDLINRLREFGYDDDHVRAMLNAPAPVPVGDVNGRNDTPSPGPQC